MINSNNIAQFLKRNRVNFRVNGTGWNTVIEKMLFEFCIAGWNLDMPVGGKEKFGGLRCYIVLEDKSLEGKIHEIVRKYEVLSGKTCEYCGNVGVRRVDNETHWEKTLCRNCYLEEQLRKMVRVPVSKNQDHLSECNICGYFAVNENKCQFCNNVVYSPGTDAYKPFLYFETEIDYIKECQMEVFLDVDNEIELNGKTKRFLKSDTHQVIFSHAELEQYLKTNKDE